MDADLALVGVQEMSNKSDLIAEVMRHEDEAREIASEIEHRHLSHEELEDTVAKLARTVARLAHATRDCLEAITTSGFRR